MLYGLTRYSLFAHIPVYKPDKVISLHADVRQVGAGVFAPGWVSSAVSGGTTFLPTYLDLSFPRVGDAHPTAHLHEVVGGDFFESVFRHKSIYSLVSVRKQESFSCTELWYLSRAFRPHVFSVCDE